MDDPPVTDDDFHRNIMLFARYWRAEQLKVVAEADQVGLQAGMLQKSVVKTFAVADAVTGKIEGHPRYDDQVGFVSLMVGADRAWFQDAESSLLQGMQSLHQPEYHMCAADRRIQDPFAGVEGMGQNFRGIGFVVGRSIQRNAFGLTVFLQRKQILLCRVTGGLPRIMAKCPSPRQKLRTK